LRPRRLFVALLFGAFASQGCSSCTNTAQGILGIMPGVVNDPANRSLRAAILGYGMKQFCDQVQKHDAPLALTPGANFIGRFYATTCSAQELQNGDWFVQFSGFGYAWTNLSKKLTFSMTGAVDYNADFQMSGSTMYIYFRPRQVTSSNFASRVIEQPVAQFLNSLSNLGNTFGTQLVNGQLQAGFTVIRDTNGSTDFSIGIIDVGKRPLHPIDVHGSDRVTWENARVEVHSNERDFVGPIEVTESGRAIYVSGQVDGVPAVDVLLLRKDVGDGSLQLYYNYPLSGPLAGPPLAQAVMTQGQAFNQSFKVDPGMYYVVFDNTPSAGVVMPPPPLASAASALPLQIGALLTDNGAIVSYAAQIGDAP
jgi:hypothetical protein